jgi:hypothetical protein
MFIIIIIILYVVNDSRNDDYRGIARIRTISIRDHGQVKFNTAATTIVPINKLSRFRQSPYTILTVF